MLIWNAKTKAHMNINEKHERIAKDKAWSQISFACSHEQRAFIDAESVRLTCEKGRPVTLAETMREILEYYRCGSK